jgi:hypothetical protein
MSDNDPNWPKNKNGTPKRIGDMTPAERDRVLRPLVDRLNEELRAERGEDLERR